MISHWERVEAAMRGERLDRPPICLWRHWPIEDEQADSLAAAMIRWQQSYDCDLVKHAPTGHYVIYDWGGQTRYVPEQSRGLGVSTVTRWAVESAEAFAELPVLDPTQGHLAQQVEAVRQVTAALGPQVPLLQTVFSPLNIAPKLAGELARELIVARPALFRRGLAAIAESMARFAQACLRAGAAGIIFSTPHNQRLYSEAQLEQFGEPYDQIILEAARPEAKLIVGLVSGPENDLKRIAGYPVDGVNWHDRIGGPSLAEAADIFPGLLMGGIHEKETLLQGPAQAIREEIQEAVEQTGGRRLLISSGSAPYTDTPPAHFQAARDFVESLAG